MWNNAHTIEITTYDTRGAEVTINTRYHTHQVTYGIRPPGKTIINRAMPQRQQEVPQRVGDTTIRVSPEFCFNMEIRGDTGVLTAAAVPVPMASGWNNDDAWYRVYTRGLISNGGRE